MGRIPSSVSWVFIVAVITASGFVYNLLFFDGPFRPIVSTTYALFTGMPLLAFERGVFLPRLYDWMHRLATPAYLLSAFLFDLVMIAIGFAAAGTLLKSTGLMTGTWPEVTILQADVLIYAMSVTAILIVVLRVRELLGRDVFLSLITARYRKPVSEERIFLFVDLVGSTSFAEEFGDLRAQQFLSALFASFTRSVRKHKGAIDDYVGDCAIITWPMARGTHGARCVRCAFDILADIEAHAEVWQKNYGRVPRLRVALHGGPIVTAEIGVDHHKITYFGDTINTTARLENLCKVLDRPILISSELRRRIRMPGNIAVEDLGDHAVRGRDQTLGVLALQRVGEETLSARPRGRAPLRASVGTASA